MVQIGLLLDCVRLIDSIVSSNINIVLGVYAHSGPVTCIEMPKISQRTRTRHVHIHYVVFLTDDSITHATSQDVKTLYVQS